MKKLLKFLVISILVLGLSFAMLACTATEAPSDQDVTDGGQTDGDVSSDTDGGITDGGDANGDDIGGDVNDDSGFVDGNFFIFEESADGTGVTLTSVSLTKGMVEIPTTYWGKPVVGISSIAFYSNETVVEVSIPDTVTTIGERAFSACVNLQKVNFGEDSALKSIGDRAFFNCERLVECILPLSIAEIGSEAFANCYDYQNLSAEGVNLSEYTISRLGHSAFENTKWFEDLDTLGDVFIGKCAYTYIVGDNQEGQTYQVEYTSSDVVAVGEKALYGLEYITSVHIGAQVTYIGEKAFCNMPSLQTITVDEANPYYSSEGNCLVEKSTSKLLTAVATSVVPSTVTVIGSEAYAFRRDIGSVTLSNAVVTVEPNAFEGSSLTSITLPEGLSTISERLFLNCDELQSVRIGESVTSIGSAAFNGCTSLKEVTVESEDVLERCSGKLLSPAGLMAYAETVYVKEGMEAISTYLVDSFEVVTSDREGYVKYIIEK